MLNNLKVKTRLFILLCISILSIIIMGVLSIFVVHNTNEQLDNVYLGTSHTDDLYELRLDYGVRLVEVLNKADWGVIDPSEAIQTIQKTLETSSKNWTEYKNSDSYLDPKNQRIQEKLLPQMDQAINKMSLLLDKFILALQQQDREKITSLLKNDYYKSLDEIRNSLKPLIKLHLDDSEQDYNFAKDEAKWIDATTIIIFLLCLAMTIPLTMLIIRSITKPLQFSVDAVDRIAKGETDIEIKEVSGGELGQLLSSLQNMIGSTGKMSSALSSIAIGDLTTEVEPRSAKDTLGLSLNDMSTQLRRMIGEIKEEVNSLTTSSEEIIASLSQLSAGSTETAAAVTETTTTVEELKQTSHVSVDKAKEVLSSVEEALQKATAGEKSVLEALENMGQIRDRMQVISESILKLSEKSLAISEIMDTVNDIAEQSNLLAVNAAIEAAKAGEQGRSFNIVAQEIRTLAEQSKSATLQVRSLLSEIQNATNAAVLATEQGSKAVAKGSEQSSHTNEAIKELSSNMARVSHAANQIVLSNEQQQIGTEQITVSMRNISEATNQHVEHLKQIESAVTALNNVGVVLKDLTGQYQLSTENNRSRVIEQPEKKPKGFVKNPYTKSFAASKSEQYSEKY